jgi:hypothetical protein
MPHPSRKRRDAMDSHAIDARADLYRVLYRANAILGAHDM